MRLYTCIADINQVSFSFVGQKIQNQKQSGVYCFILMKSRGECFSYCWINNQKMDLGFTFSFPSSTLLRRILISQFIGGAVTSDLTSLTKHQLSPTQTHTSTTEASDLAFQQSTYFRKFPIISSFLTFLRCKFSARLLPVF